MNANRLLHVSLCIGYPILRYDLQLAGSQSLLRLTNRKDEKIDSLVKFDECAFLAFHSSQSTCKLSNTQMSKC